MTARKAARAQQEEWISGRAAAEIISTNSGHVVSPDYVRLRSNQGKITARHINGRFKEYLKSDVEAYVVTGKGRNRKQVDENAA